MLFYQRVVAQRKVGVKIETQHPSNVTWHKLETNWAGAAGGCQDLSILTGTCPDRSATANLVTSSWCCLEQICGWHFSICVLCKIISRPFVHNIYLSIDLSFVDRSIDLSIDLSIYRSIDLSIYLSIDCIYVYNQVYDLIIILPKILQDHLNPLRSPCRSPWIPVY